MAGAVMNAAMLALSLTVWALCASAAFGADVRALVKYRIAKAKALSRKVNFGSNRWFEHATGIAYLRGILRAIEFPRIKGGKPFNTEQAWFDELLKGIGQPRGTVQAVAH